MWELKHKEGWALKNLMLLNCGVGSPLYCKEIKPVNPKRISPEYALEGLMLKLKLQYIEHLTRRVDSLEKTLMLGKFEGMNRRGWQRTKWLDDITRRWWRTRKPGTLPSLGLQRVGHDWVTEEPQPVLKNRQDNLEEQKWTVHATKTEDLWWSHCD